MFRRRGKPNSAPSGDVYVDLRSTALEVTQAILGRTPPEHSEVLGAVIDIPGERGMASVVALADGTTSMYTSTGGGTVGAGAHETVAAATRALLAKLQGSLDVFPPDERVDLPTADLVPITVMTPTGRRRASVPAAAFWGQEPSTVLELIAAIQDARRPANATGRGGPPPGSVR